MTIIACDVDGVIADTLSAAREEMAELRGMRPDDILDTWIYHDPFTHPDPGTAALLRTSHAFWSRPTLLDRARPLPGSVSALWRLHDAGLLRAYVTRRPESVALVTRRWIAREGFPVVPIHHVGHDDADMNHEACKSDACRAEGATHLVDDSQHEAETALIDGIVPILVDHPLGRLARNEWLRTHPQVRLVRDIAEAADLLLAA